MVEPFSLNFRVFTVKLVGVQKFRSFTVHNFLFGFYDPSRSFNLV